MAVLQIDFVYKQGKNYHPQVHAEELKYTDTVMMMMMMMDFLSCKKNTKKRLL